MSHQIALRIYYEDTDLAGIAYYANYLKFIERGRSDWLRDIGVDQRAMKAAGVVFAVRRVEADYLRPAFFEDMVQVRTSLRHLGAARIVVDQQVLRADAVLFTACVTVACIGPAGRAVRLPRDVVARLQAV